VAGAHDDAERVQVESIDQWRAWLEANDEQPGGVWLVTFRKGSGRSQVPYVDLVEEALCHGWIDSTARPLDAERSMIWFAPRRRGSVWAASNRERVERLEREGRVRPAGLSVVERARADGSWSVLIPAERLEVPDDLAEALVTRPGAWPRWEALTPSVRTQALASIITAKRADTRARRVAEVADRTAAGERPV
jgi:uncharacterized protein YdeI (YjbR/CyaY-like superfamily)